MGSFRRFRTRWGAERSLSDSCDCACRAETTLRRVALKDFRQLEVPVASRETQQQIGELYEQVQKLKSIAANIRTTITQLEDLALEAAGAAVPLNEIHTGG